MHDKQAIRVHLRSKFISYFQVDKCRWTMIQIVQKGGRVMQWKIFIKKCMKNDVSHEMELSSQ